MEPFKLDCGPYIVRLIENEHELKEAQLLRFHVFSKDLPIPLSPESEAQHRDHDQFDPYCDHLIAVEKDTGTIAGTYRLMRGSAARKGIGFYCETEFDAAEFYSLSGEVLELGRSCVRKEYRDKGVIGLLWGGICAYFIHFQCDYLAGMVSIPVSAHPSPSDIYAFLKTHYWSPRGALLSPLPEKTYVVSESDGQISFRDLPALLKGYLRLGCRLIGAPAVDGDKTADFPILVDVAQIEPDYFSRFTRKAS